MKLKLEGRFASAALKAPSPKVILGLRPEDLTLANSDGATQIPAHIEAIETMGAETHLHTKTAAHSLIARLPGAAADAEHVVDWRT